MKHEYWHAKWKQNQLGFHQTDANTMLVTHFETVVPAPNARVFVPLCGKSLDMCWLHDQGHHVIGSELSEQAVRDFFDQIDVTPSQTPCGPLKCFSAPGYDIFTGDIFAVTPEMIGPVQAVYDRAALVALPTDMRPRYAAHVARLTDFAPQLLISFDYDQSVMQGPPFSIDADQMAQLYGEIFTLKNLQSAEVEGGLKGFCPATAIAWHLYK